MRWGDVTDGHAGRHVRVTPAGGSPVVGRLRLSHLDVTSPGDEARTYVPGLMYLVEDGTGRRADFHPDDEVDVEFLDQPG